MLFLFRQVLNCMALDTVFAMNMALVADMALNLQHSLTLYGSRQSAYAMGPVAVYPLV